VKLFGRKDRSEEPENPQDTVESAPVRDSLDPRTVALPADAGVTGVPAETAAGQGAADAPPDPGARVGEVPPPPVMASPDPVPDPKPDPDPAPLPDPEPGPEPDPAPLPDPEIAAPRPAEPAPKYNPPAYQPPSPVPVSSSSSSLASLSQRPEVLVAGAFVGAFLLARILKRITE
jgi:hypothetical protein